MNIYKRSKGAQMGSKRGVSGDSMDHMIVYQISDPINPLSTTPLCSQLDPIFQIHMKRAKGNDGHYQFSYDDAFAGDGEFYFSPSDVFILDNVSNALQPKIMSYSIHSGQKSILTTLKPSDVSTHAREENSSKRLIVLSLFGMSNGQNIDFQSSIQH